MFCSLGTHLRLSSFQTKPLSICLCSNASPSEILNSAAGACLDTGKSNPGVPDCIFN